MTQIDGSNVADKQRPWTRLESDETARYLYDTSDDWFFEKGKISLTVKLMAVKLFVSSYAPCHIVDSLLHGRKSRPVGGR